MAKIGKQVAKRNLAGVKRVRLADRSAPTRAPAPGELLEGHVVAVETGGVRVELAGGRTAVALRPAHIDERWLAQAVRKAPVPAVLAVARPTGRLVLTGLFPGPAHAGIKLDIAIEGRDVRIDADAIHINSRNAQLRLAPDGDVELRGRNVTSHAKRINRVKGGAIRLN
jgi:hypothetical protein